MDVTLRDNEYVDVEAKPVSAKGNPAKVQNAQWVSSDTSLVTCTPVPGDETNTLKARVLAVGPVTAVDTPAKVTFDADADLGEGVKNVQGVLGVVVIASDAVTIDIAAGTPSPQA